MTVGAGELVILTTGPPPLFVEGSSRIHTKFELASNSLPSQPSEDGIVGLTDK